jgi:hypothetical protein
LTLGIEMILGKSMLGDNSVRTLREGRVTVFLIIPFVSGIFQNCIAVLEKFVFPCITTYGY